MLSCMRLSFSTGTFYHRSIAYALNLARDAGFDGVELVAGPEYVWGGLARIARAVSNSAVPVLSVHPPLLRLPGWPYSSVERMQRLSDLTQSVGAEAVVVHVPSIAAATSPRSARFTRAIEHAQQLLGPAACITLETTQYFQHPSRHLLDDVQRLVEYASARGCGITLDTCHAGANGEDVLECYRIVRPLLRNVHLSDVTVEDQFPHTHRMPGEGMLPLADLLATMAADRYAGLVTLEVRPGQVGLVSRSHQLLRLRQALAFMRSAIAKGAELPSNIGSD